MCARRWRREQHACFTVKVLVPQVATELRDKNYEDHMLIYLKKYGDLVTIFRERAPTNAEKKRDRTIKRVREAVTVRFQKAGRDPVIEITKVEQR